MNAAPRTISDPFQPIENASATLPAGALAPDFALKSTPDQIVRLSEFRGQPVVLVFYPADWSPVCGDQVSLYNEVLSEFQAFGAEVLGISVDGPWCSVPRSFRELFSFDFRVNREAVTGW